MDVKVKYNKLDNPDAAYQAAKSFLTPEMIATWKVKATVNYQDSSRLINAKGRGFELNICFLDDAAEVTLKLSILLRPVKGKVLSTIERHLSEVV